MHMESFGALPNINSIRIYDYEQLPKKDVPSGSSGITDYSIPEDRLPDVRNQGEVGSCVAHAVIETLEVLHYVATGEKITLSPGYFYGHNRSKESTGWGMITSDAIKRTREYGSVPTTMFNEHCEMPKMKEIVNSRPDLEPFAAEHKINSYVTFLSADKDAKWNQIKEAFLTYNLPMVAVAPTYFRESHCILIYGFEETGGHRNLKYQNSWGSNYADGGRSTIPFEKISEVFLLFDDKIELPFKDVPESAWYYKNILNMYASGLIKGKSETEFAPDEFITRAELCAILDRLTAKIDDKDDATMRSVYDYVDRRYNMLKR